MARNRNRNPFAGQQQGVNGAQIVPMLVHPQLGILGPATPNASFSGTQAGFGGGSNPGLGSQGVPGAKQLRKLMRTMQFGQDRNTNTNTNTQLMSQIRGVPGAKQIRRMLRNLQGGQGGQSVQGGNQGGNQIQHLIQALLQAQGGQGQGVQGWGQQQQGFSGYGPQGYGRGEDFSGYGPRGGGSTRSDDQIREDIVRTLTDHPRIDAREIDVRVRNGEVTLEGQVPHREMKSEAYRLIDRVSGVQQVFDTVRVAQYTPVGQNRRQDQREARQSAS